jgi:hypothetical protein
MYLNQSRPEELIWVEECGTFKINCLTFKFAIMNVDVEIYMNGIIKFFKNNPKDLLTLIPKGKEDEFYEKIRETSLTNIDKGDEVSLTQKQILDICVLLNGKNPNDTNPDEQCIMETRFGKIFLN